MTIDRNPDEGKDCFNKISLEFLFGRSLQSWVTQYVGMEKIVASEAIQNSSSKITENACRNMMFMH